MKRYVIKRPAGTPAVDRLARYREELNTEQYAVATAPAGAALVIAGAGSGKTRAITYRVAYLVEHGIEVGEPAEQIGDVPVDAGSGEVVGGGIERGHRRQPTKRPGRQPLGRRSRTARAAVPTARPA